MSSYTPTVRELLSALWSPLAEIAGEIGQAPPGWPELRGGRPVRLSAESLQNVRGHPAVDVLDIDSSDWWLLTGASTLTPVDAP